VQLRCPDDEPRPAIGHTKFERTGRQISPPRRPLLLCFVRSRGAATSCLSCCQLPRGVTVGPGVVTGCAGAVPFILAF